MDISADISTKNAQETSEVGQKLGRLAKGDSPSDRAPVYCLYGDLGSGKTTFVQGFAQGLGLTRRLPSPTFIIVRRYDLHTHFRHLYHIDLYRAQGSKDLATLGLAEIFSDPSAIVLVEWAERLKTHAPDMRTDVHFTVGADGSHHITVQKIGTK